MSTTSEVTVARRVAGTGRETLHGARASLFANCDPMGFEASDANLYRYVENNPTNATDPSGLAGWVPEEVWRLEFNRQQQFAWLDLQKAGWAIKHQTEVSKGVDFGYREEVDVEVTDDKMLKMLAEGHDIQWKDKTWAVDFTTGRIWVDVDSRQEAAAHMKMLIKELHFAGKRFGFRKIHRGRGQTFSNYDIDVYLESRTSVLGSLKSHLLSPANRKLVLPNRNQKDPALARLYMTLVRLKKESLRNLVEKMVDIIPTSGGRPGFGTLIDTTKAALEANEHNDLMNKIENAQKKK